MYKSLSAIVICKRKIELYYYIITEDPSLMSFVYVLVVFSVRNILWRLVCVIFELFISKKRVTKTGKCGMNEKLAIMIPAGKILMQVDICFLVIEQLELGLPVAGRQFRLAIAYT